MRNYSAADVDEYIANAPADSQLKLKELRALVKSMIPKVDEKISWGVPFYRYQGLLAGYSAFKDHVSFGLVFRLTDQDRKELEAKGYKTGSKTVQIKFDQKLPTSQIKRLLKTQAQLNEAKKAIKK